MENLIETYRQELSQIAGGKNCCKLLPRAVRRRFRGYGILLKIGGIYKVTPKGKEMLAVVGDVKE